jgi:hypothetical protein
MLPPMKLACAWTAVAWIAAGCGSDVSMPDAGPPPTYTELYARYFADGTQGHCAKAGCHGDPGHNTWLCGPTKDSCYAGMVAAGIIDPASPRASTIGDPKNSPINWVNPNGPMPFDQPSPPVPFPEGRAAIVAWVAAGAANN